MCAAPSGNQFWKIRSKHGRDKLFETPKLLWEAATEYFQWVDTHPWFRNEPIKSGEKLGTTMKVNIARPYTMHGLCLYLGCDPSYFRTFKLEQATKPESKDFLTIIETIEGIIYQQKFEGAVVGAFNANIISRDLGLIDRQENNLLGKNITVSISDE